MGLFKKNIRIINFVLFVVLNSLFLNEVVNTTSFFSYLLLGLDIVLLVVLIFSALQTSVTLQYFIFWGLVSLLMGFAVLIRLEGNPESITSNDTNVKERVNDQNKWIKIPSIWETDLKDDLILRLNFLNPDTVSFSMSPTFEEAYFLYDFSKKELVLRSIETKKVKFDWKVKSLNNNYFVIYEDGEEVKFMRQE